MSPIGDMPAKMKSNPEQEHDPRYQDLLHALKRRQQNDFKIGALLEQALAEQLYGPYKSFEEFVEIELHISRSQGHRLIFANTIREVLKVAEAKTLPTVESQVRPLSRLQSMQVKLRCYEESGGVDELDDNIRTLQIRAWENACRLKKRDHPPTAVDVTREVNRVLRRRSKFPLDQSLRTYREHLAKMHQFLVRANRLLEEGNLDSFFLLCHQPTEEGELAARRRQRIGQELSSTSFLLSKQCNNFGSLSADQAGSLFGLKPEKRNSRFISEMSAKELKLLALGLDKAATPGEIANAALKFFECLRARGIGLEDIEQ